LLNFSWRSFILQVRAILPSIARIDANYLCNFEQKHRQIVAIITDNDIHGSQQMALDKLVQAIIKERCLIHQFLFLL